MFLFIIHSFRPIYNTCIVFDEAGESLVMLYCDDDLSKTGRQVRFSQDLSYGILSRRKEEVAGTGVLFLSIRYRDRCRFALLCFLLYTAIVAAGWIVVARLLIFRAASNSSNSRAHSSAQSPSLVEEVIQ